MSCKGLVLKCFAIKTIMIISNSCSLAYSNFPKPNKVEAVVLQNWCPFAGSPLKMRVFCPFTHHFFVILQK